MFQYKKKTIEKAGQYDISGNSRHRMKEIIYDHSVENIYDFAYQRKQLSDGENTYDHTY